MRCCVCGEEIKGRGNNPRPLVEKDGARCCDRCNAHVIVERLKRARKEA